MKFSKRRVEASISKRGGECLQCAKCCELLVKCPYLTKDRLCRVYNSWLRPEVCVRFPIDRTDIEDVRRASGGQCGYNFSD